MIPGMIHYVQSYQFYYLIDCQFFPLIQCFLCFFSQFAVILLKSIYEFSSFLFPLKSAIFFCANSCFAVYFQSSSIVMKALRFPLSPQLSKLNQSLSGITISFFSSQTFFIQSSNFLAYLYSLAFCLSILFWSDFSKSYFYFYLSISICYFLFFQINSIVLLTVYVTQQSGETPVTLIFLTSPEARYSPNSFNPFHRVLENLINLFDSVSYSLQTISKCLASPGYFVLRIWMNLRSMSQLYFMITYYGLDLYYQTRFWCETEFRWQMQPFQSRHSLRHNQQKFFSLPEFFIVVKKGK